MERLIYDVATFTIRSHIFSDSVGENALNVLHTLQQQTGILQPPFLPSTGECIELVLKFVNYIYEFHGLMVLAHFFLFLLCSSVLKHVRYNTREDIAIAFLASCCMVKLERHMTMFSVRLTLV